jgi:aspartate carbamoyltransferase catalytic subunit
MANLISLKNFSKSKILQLIDMAFFMQNNISNLKDLHKNKILTTAFFEPSTRTKLSFMAAAYKLGLDVLDFNKDLSSQKKGESLSDTIKILSGYSDLLVIRSNQENFFKGISSSCPIINAGDGKNEHPTQALIDLFTIKKEFGTIDGLNILIVGDLKNGRTVHSLLYGLSNFDVNVFLYCPSQLKLEKNFFNEINQKLKISYLPSFDLTNIDVLYLTRVQYERFKSKKPKRIENSYSLNQKILQKAKSTLKILHPLPRLAELPEFVDQTNFACYFKQAKNGLYMRMALIDYCLKNIDKNEE